MSIHKEREKLKVLHVLGASIPAVAGYSIRSKYIVESQKAMGIEPVVVTSPIQPTETPKDEPWHEVINDITYFRSPGTGRTASLYDKTVRKGGFLRAALTKHRLMRGFENYVVEVARKERPTLIHAHSPFYCADAAYKAARSLGVPFVYELRAMWEETVQANSQMSIQSIGFWYTRYKETQNMRRADALTTLCEGMKKEIASRGIREDKVFVVQNGVDISRFIPLNGKDPELASKYGLGDSVVFGFIGEIRKLEGLDLLVRAFPEISKRCGNARLLVVGEGEDKDRLQLLASQLHLDGKVIFAGKVPHAEVTRYYSLCDTLVYPRTGARVCENVTPLKPLEAMALDKTVLISDVGGLTELVKDGETGLAFRREDVDDLVRKAVLLAERGDLRAKLSRQGRDWVGKERQWINIVKKYREVYEEAIKRHNGSGVVYS